VDTSVDRARWRFTASYAFYDRFQAGVEFNAAVTEFNPLATFFVLTETERRPALFLGTSSDRIGSPEGTQAFYATLSKYVPLVRTSGYVALNYSEWDSGFNVPFGAGFEVGRGFAARYMYDGQSSHLLLDYYYREQGGVTLMWVWLDTIGLALHGGF
jgi:long-subunit fatty acid transport protein